MRNIHLLVLLASAALLAGPALSQPASGQGGGPSGAQSGPQSGAQTGAQTGTQSKTQDADKTRDQQKLCDGKPCADQDKEMQRLHATDMDWLDNYGPAVGTGQGQPGQGQGSPGQGPGPGSGSSGQGPGPHGPDGSGPH